jgi:hypothetical protein
MIASEKNQIPKHAAFKTMDMHIMYFRFHLSANIADGSSVNNTTKLQKESSSAISDTDKPLSLKSMVYSA